jgi:lia operon protein LiaF
MNSEENSMSHQRKNGVTFWLGSMLVALGLLSLLKSLAIFSFDFIFENFWAWAIIALGIFLVYKSFLRLPSRSEKVTFSNSTENYIQAENMFGDLAVTLDQHDFKGGHLRTVFGKLSVDGVKLSLPPGAHILHLEVTFGEIMVWLPKDLPVRIVANNTAGDVHIFNQKWGGLSKNIVWQSDAYDSSDSKLEIVCSITFGDIKIKYSPL